MTLTQYHKGEIALQEQTGQREFAETLAKRITPYITTEAAELLAASPFIVISGLFEGMPTASILSGPPGFIRSTKKEITINATLRHTDPLSSGAIAGEDLGLIVIDLAKGVRYRINGRIIQANSTLKISVSQCYRNCPQYIHKRTARYIEVPNSRPPSSLMISTKLDGKPADLVAKADTCFIASHGSGHSKGDTRLGADISHRGGNPGFVKIVDDGHRLVMPDYVGNFMFNTMGNLLEYPHCGLLFIDFEKGDLLQISGKAKIDFASSDIETMPGAQRLLNIDIDQSVYTPAILPLQWDLLSQAPDLKRFEIHTRAEDTKPIATVGRTRPGFRKLVVSHIVEEAAGIRSLYLKAGDGKSLPAFTSGQYLPVRMKIPNLDRPIIRTYSLSNYASQPTHYRIGVRRIDGTPETPAGLGSNFIHSVQAGDILEVGEPAGRFTVDPDDAKPLVLISAGIGVTPALSMLNALIKSETKKPIWFIHGARNGAEQAYASEIKRLTYGHSELNSRICYSAPSGRDFPGRDYDDTGRINIDRIPRALPKNTQYYICGPDGFMTDLKNGLLENGVISDNIHTEAFTSAPDNPAGKIGSKVQFGTEGPVLIWKSGTKSLLDLAEAHGLSPEYSCRMGNCGTCAYQLLSGEVHYPEDSQYPPPEDGVLLCSACPMSDIVIGKPL